MKTINGHAYNSYYAGFTVFVVDGKDYYDVDGAAKALGLSVEEFMRVW